MELWIVLMNTTDIKTSPKHHHLSTLDESKTQTVQMYDIPAGGGSANSAPLREITNICYILFQNERNEKRLPGNIHTACTWTAAHCSHWMDWLIHCKKKKEKFN